MGDVTNILHGTAPSLPALPPPDYCDAVIEAYKKDVDRTLLRENLKLTVDQRFQKFERFLEYALELREAGRRRRYMILEKLIQLKRAAGRPKDLQIIAELQALLDERQKPESPM